MTSFPTRRTPAAVVLAVFALLATGLSTPSTAATSTGALKGVITLDSRPVASARVQVYRTIRDVTNGEDIVKPTRVKTTHTDQSGKYALSGLPVKPGYVYNIVVTHRRGSIVKAVRLVAPKKGKTVTKNVRTQPAATIRGTVATVDGRSPAGLTVAAEIDFGNLEGADYQVFYPDGMTTIAADGSFTLSGLPATPNYDGISISDGRYAKQCYDFTASTLADCAPSDPAVHGRQRLGLAAGEVRTLPPVTVTTFAPPVTNLTGAVTDTSGKPIGKIGVRFISDSGLVDVSTVTRSSGRFALSHRIPGGSYIVRFDDPRNVWAAQYLGGGPDKSVRQRITVTPGESLSGLTTRLKSLSTAKVASKSGSGSAKVAFLITRKASGGAPSGTLTLSAGDLSQTVAVKKGKATITLTGLSPGKHSLRADYSGTATTAGFSRTVKVTVK